MKKVVKEVVIFREKSRERSRNISEKKVVKEAVNKVVIFRRKSREKSREKSRNISGKIS